MFQGLQVEPHPILGYRPKVGVYKLLKNIKVPYGIAKANPKFGSGELEQFVIKDFASVLKLINEIELED